jgi:hypothetical protein
MKRLIFLIGFVCIFSFSVTQVGAVSLTLEPLSQGIMLGEKAAVDLKISGLGDFTTPSLGAFYAEILFDESILSFDSVLYGGFLGDPENVSVFETDIETKVGPGFVSLDEISWLESSDLDSIQPSAFTLATFYFTGIDLGTSPLTFGDIDLSDALFPASSIQPQLTMGAQIDVSPVPEPATFLLMMSGLVGVGALGRRKRSHTHKA